MKSLRTNNKYIKFRMLKIISKLIIFTYFVVNVYSQYFTTNSTDFLIKVNGDWERFGRFGAVNLGVTKPGYQPGDVILRKEDYMIRFRRAEALGVRVIRVYALLHPEFYEALLDWNENNDHKIYVLHGTAFPEYEMEGLDPETLECLDKDDDGRCIEGADVYNPDTKINEMMKDFIHRTVKGVYGQGEVVYKDRTQTIGNYQHNIAKYLLGWVIGGEIPPTCVNRTNVFTGTEKDGVYINQEYRTNDAYTIGSITNEASTYVITDETTPNGRLTSPFEFWVAKMLDYLAVQIDNTGHQTPISHTNWITTDGITNLVEARVNDNYTESVEDWEEIDFTAMKFNNWPGYYNQHAYPYYPHLVHERNFENEEDPFITYIQRLNDHYHNTTQSLPFIITEIGISTSLGVASRDPHFGRNHGGVKEEDQGRIMKELMTKIYNDTDTYGMVIFQMHDEWFKKSWNTKPYESKERQTWLNVLSAEQGFGIFSTRPDETKLEYSEENKGTQLEKLSVSSDSAYLHIKVKAKEDVNEGTILIGLDSWENKGTKEISTVESDYKDDKGQNLFRVNYPGFEFQNDIESLIRIDLKSEIVEFKQLQSIIPFVRNYAEWLALNEPVGHKADICKTECSNMQLFEYPAEDENGNIIIDTNGNTVMAEAISYGESCDACLDNLKFEGDGSSVFDMKPSKGRFIDWRMLVRAPTFMFPGRNDSNKNEEIYQYDNYTNSVCFDRKQSLAGGSGEIYYTIVNCPEDYTDTTCADTSICKSNYFNNLDISDLNHMIHDDFQQGIVYKPHTTWRFQPSKDNGTFEVIDNEYHVKIPWSLVGYLIPGYHIQWIPPPDTGKKFAFPKYDAEDSNPNLGINIEAAIATAGDIKVSTITNMNYKWAAWEFPKHWRIKAKKGFRDYRSAFHMWNSMTETNITDEEIEALSEYYEFDDSIPDYITIHRILVLACFIFLATVLFIGAFGSLIQRHILYCYSFQNESDLKLEGSSHRLKIINFILLIGLGIIAYIEWNISASELTLVYFLYVIMIIWDALLILLGMCIYKWDLYEEKDLPIYNDKEHAFVISSHNSSDVIGNTIKSLLEKVRPETIYVGDNGSTPQEQEATNNICYKLSKEYYEKNGLSFNDNKIINYGHSQIGNKTIAQYASVCNLPEYVKYVTCIDDDTRLHKTWEVNKVINYFQDENVAVLAYALKAEKPKYDVELFQAIEYIIAGFTKIWHSKIWSTIFNSGAFGTYRVEVLKEAFQYHNTDFNGDDLQICLNIHQLKGKKYLTQENKKHTKDYRVVTATDMIVSTIVPKCFLHLRSISPTLFKNSEPCTCDNPDLFKQRSKGWFVSKHRFIPKYLKMIFNCKGPKGIWVRLVALYELIIILNEYFIIAYLIFLSTNYGLWMLEAFMIGITVNIFSMLVFNQFVLKRNKLGIPMEAIVTQPVIYKIFMITIYRYCGLIYHTFYYLPKHRSGKLIKERLKDSKFLELIKKMYIRRPPTIENSNEQENQLIMPVEADSNNSPSNFIIEIPQMDAEQLREYGI